jgi:hypothetical protein
VKKPAQTFPSSEVAVESLARRLGKPSMTWQYHDGGGDLVGVVCRWDRGDGEKDIRPVSRQADGAWTCQGMPEPRPLYRLPEVMQSEGVVYVCEGEKAADALGSLGLIVTTSAHGSKSVSKTDWSPLADRNVVIVPDHDEPGEKYAADVARLAIEAGASSVVIVRLVDVWPGMPAAGDAHDWIEHHDATNAETFRGMIESLVVKAEPVPRPEPGAPDKSEKLSWQSFPVDLLPEPMAEYVRQSWVTLGKEADPVCIALPLLASAAAAIGPVRRFRVRHDWVTAPVIWGAVVGESGSKKSPSFNAGTRFLQERHNVNAEQWKREYAEWKSLKAEYDAAKKSRKRGEEIEPLPDPPGLTQFVVDDATIESLIPIFEARQSVLLSNDELSGWVASFDRYTQKEGADVARYLKLYDAGSWTKNRLSSGFAHVSSASLSIAGGIQPRVLAKSFGAHVYNGLLPRFMLVEPPEGFAEWPEQGVDFATMTAMNDVFDVLLALAPDEYEKPLVIDLDPDATRVFIRDWWEPVSEERRRTKGPVKSMLAKAESWAVRLAGTIHLCRQAGSEPALPHRIDVDSIERGIGLARWFAHEWKRVYAKFERGGVDEGDADGVDGRLIAWLERNGLPVTPRDVSHSCSWIETSEDAETKLDRLVQAGHGAWQDRPPGERGGRPTRAFVLA